MDLIVLGLGCAALAGLTGCDDAPKKNPAPGDPVTFRGHIRNWDNLTPSAAYRWDLDGNTVYAQRLSAERCAGFRDGD